MYTDNAESKILELEQRNGELAAQLRKLEEKLHEYTCDNRICRLCKADHTRVKGICGTSHVYLCYDCERAWKKKNNNKPANLHWQGVVYRLEPIAEEK